MAVSIDKYSCSFGEITRVSEVTLLRGGEEGSERFAGKAYALQSVGTPVTVRSIRQASSR